MKPAVSEVPRVTRRTRGSGTWLVGAQDGKVTLGERVAVSCEGKHALTL